MSNNISNFKKEGLVSVSYFNLLFSSIVNGFDIDLVRADIEEIAYITGEQDCKRITSEDVILFVKNYKNKIPLAVDVPLSVMYANNNLNISGIIDFYIKSKADYLSFDIKYAESGVIKKIVSENIKVVGYSKNNGEDFDKIKDFCVEFESNGGKAIFLENYPGDFLNKISLNIPLIADVKSKASNHYIKISDLIGMGDTQKKLLNFREIFSDTLKEYVFESKKK